MLLKKIYTIIIIMIILCINILQSIDQTIDQMKVAYWSTWKVKCGIAQYTENLYNALIKKGYKVTAYPHNITHDKLMQALEIDKPNILNIQYEPGIMPPTPVLIGLIEKIKKNNIKIILTVHNETADVKTLYNLVDALIYHKKSLYFNSPNKLNTIPFGIPVFNPENSKLNLRKKYNFKPNDVIISTAGFMTPWKEYPSILEELVPWLKSSKFNKVQLLTSFNDISYAYSKIEFNKIKKVIKDNSIHNQVIHITKYLSQQELNERLWISDLGYLWGNIQSNGTSASCKEFVASRLPFITTNSNHFHDINIGVLKTDKDKNKFIEAIKNTINNTETKKRLLWQLHSYYSKFNNDNIITQHLIVFNKVLNIE